MALTPWIWERSCRRPASSSAAAPPPPSAHLTSGRSTGGRCGLAVSVSSSNGADGLSPLSDSEKKALW
ncbi:hypothetical protein ZWY2020_050399 [Hordeum vulgare]|nr:hypothetical protein ZWY2020_050399 [Hordeum vulgare]